MLCVTVRKRLPQPVALAPPENGQNEVQKKNAGE